jgi:CheY-like chemotaxis protein
MLKHLPILKKPAKLFFLLKKNLYLSGVTQTTLMKRPRTFFIVDDDPDDVDLFIEAINEIDQSIYCESAFDGQEALQKLNDAGTILPDIIFLDLNMPRINGMQCLTELKTNKKLSHIPIVIYTTSSSQKDLDETKESGASYFLTKPSSFKELCSILSGIISGELI